MGSCLHEHSFVRDVRGDSASSHKAGGLRPEASRRLPTAPGRSCPRRTCKGCGGTRLDRRRQEFDDGLSNGARLIWQA